MVFIPHPESRITYLIHFMINVLVVDDSAFSRRIITKILESIPDVKVVETATDGQDALKKVIRTRPDLITLDLEMPLMDGFTFLRWVMNNMPTPVIVVSAQEADENVFKAMDLGAVDFLVKPTRHASMQLEEIKADLIEKVLAIPLLKMRKIKERLQSEETKAPSVAPVTTAGDRPRVICIASSTGGPPAIQTILSELPKGFEVPILVAQHMPPAFTALFAERLNKYTSMVVKEAANEDVLQPSTVYIAPGGKHLVVEKRSNKYILLHKDKQLDPKYSPSANVLFSSVADEMDGRAVGTVLTGMGDDGREGSKKLKTKGAVIIAESEQTAIIFGMPQETIRAGVVDHILPLHEIARQFTTLCQ
ncbi:MAG: chemotaxis response regulator protein-glutamate methylesterase [Acidobacteria bacterium]|nr:MAG: chemotaxis response regulator protein-glutamate methylesterase [Acidobacteriota bacterium]